MIENGKQAPKEVKLLCRCNLSIDNYRNKLPIKLKENPDSNPDLGDAGIVFNELSGQLGAGHYVGHMMTSFKLAY